MKKKILIVDDTAEVRDVLQRLLTFKGYEVRVAENGLAALKLIRLNQFEMIFLDVWMPHLNGLELLRVIRNCGNSSRVIMLSGDNNPVMAMHTMELGACDYLSKPLDLPQIEQALSYHAVA